MGKSCSAAVARVYFLDTACLPLVPLNRSLPQIRCALQVNGGGKLLTLPPGVSLVLQDQTPSGLARRLAKLIADLAETADQRIVRWGKSGGAIEVEFLDGQCFTFRGDSKHEWDTLSLGPNATSLIVSCTDGTPQSIPWDYIRRPKNHMSEELKTRRRIASVLKHLRQTAGMSQSAAADKSNLSRATINRLEKAGHYPGLQTLTKLAETYGTTIQNLINTIRA